MNNIETKIFLQTRHRNLKRKYAKIIQHTDLTDEALELKKEIDEIEAQIELNGGKEYF